jgi:DNA replication protein DnaC
VICPVCKGKTFIFVEGIDGEEDIWKPCDCRIKLTSEMILKYQLEESSIPGIYIRYTVDNVFKNKLQGIYQKVNKESFEFIKLCVDNTDNFIGRYSTLWIWGIDPNAGHTTLACNIGMALIRKGYKVKFIKMQKLVDMFMQFETKESFFNNFEKYDVYILDDTFVQNRSSDIKQYSFSHFFNFIDESLNKNKHFIMTSDRNLMQVEDLSNKKLEEFRILLLRSIKTLEVRDSVVS